MSNRWDCVIVGAGPAGLSAAIYMGRFRRSTLVLDDATGRWTYGQRTENYLGFPRGIGARRLAELGRSQAKRFGVKFEMAQVTRVARTEGGFGLYTSEGLRRARTVIWAAGVRDSWPSFTGARALVGRRLFWCIVCDGWRVRGKRVLIVGRSLLDARTALQFLTYTSRLTFLVEPGHRLRKRVTTRLEGAGIRVVRGAISRVRSLSSGALRITSGDTAFVADYLFSLIGCLPRTEPLTGLPLRYSEQGHISVDPRGLTAVPGFFAAGDVDDLHSHQVSAAVHEGATVAQAANFSLYPSQQRIRDR